MYLASFFADLNTKRSWVVCTIRNSFICMGNILLMFIHQEDVSIREPFYLAVDRKITILQPECIAGVSLIKTPLHL